VDKLEGDERKKVLEEIRQINPNCSFPTIIIGDKIIVGFRADEIKEALNL
jgi:glutaredoxin-like protein NrdH